MTGINEAAAIRPSGSDAWRLYVPFVAGGEPAHRNPYRGLVEDLGLTDVVSIVDEEAERNQVFLASCVDPTVERAVAYLERACGGSSPVIQYFVGDQITPALTALSKQDRR